MPDGDSAKGACAPQAPAPAFALRANWFSDLQFHWDASLTVRATGVRITLKELTAGELGKFFGYLGVVLWQGFKARLRPGRKYRVWFTPARPRPWYVVWSAATLAGVRLARSEADADAAFYFEDVTQGVPPRIERGVLLNGDCPDISKSRVAAAFAQAAGYDLAVDPATHLGVAVEKGEANGLHDGRLVQCPLAPQPGKTYQRFVDSSDGETAFDYRTTVIGRRPLFVLVKTRPAADRFSIHNATVQFKPLAEIFSAEEIALIARFAEEMKLDWAAIDVLRDRATKRIYIVDVNKTDTGPAVDLSWSDREKLKSAIAAAFLAMVAQHARAPVDLASPPLPSRPEAGSMPA